MSPGYRDSNAVRPGIKQRALGRAEEFSFSYAMVPCRGQLDFS